MSKRHVSTIVNGDPELARAAAMAHIASGERWLRAQLASAINTTPLVDVMLVLLIIFLITIPVVTHTVALQLPKDAAKDVAEKAALALPELTRGLDGKTPQRVIVVPNRIVHVGV